MSDAFEYFTPPSKSFGIDKSEHSVINWSYFWQLFNQHSAWDLEYNNGGGWISCKYAMTITKVNPPVIPDPAGDGSGSIDISKQKITMEFTAPYTADYRLTFAIDSKVKDYIEKVGEHRYELNYKVGEHDGEDEVYSVIFDWSDIFDIPGIIITHGIKDIGGVDCFWFRARKNSVSQGAHIELDPWFGSQDITETASELTSDEDILTFKATAPENGYAESIFIYVKKEGSDKLIQGLLYTDGLTFVANGATVSTDVTSTDYSWIECKFNYPKPKLVRGTVYRLGFHADPTSAINSIWWKYTHPYGDSDQFIRDSNTGYSYPSYPTPLTNDFENDLNVSIYCTYSIPTTKINKVAGKKVIFTGTSSTKISIG